MCVCVPALFMESNPQGYELGRVSFPAAGRIGACFRLGINRDRVHISLVVKIFELVKMDKFAYRITNWARRRWKRSARRRQAAWRGIERASYLHVLSLSMHEHSLLWTQSLFLLSALCLSLGPSLSQIRLFVNGLEAFRVFILLLFFFRFSSASIFFRR